jgi:hypothetical protein
MINRYGKDQRFGKWPSKALNNIYAEKDEDGKASLKSYLAKKLIC